MGIGYRLNPSYVACTKRLRSWESPDSFGFRVLCFEFENSEPETLNPKRIRSVRRMG